MKQRYRLAFEPLGESTELQGSSCPHCHCLSLAASAIHTNPESIPHAGAISICDRCGGVGIFAEDLSVRKMTDEEMTDLKRTATWPEVERLSRLIRAAVGTMLIGKPNKNKRIN